MSERKEVYVLGHRNPDTDSICSAIAYADVKNKENDGNHYVAARAGQISSETSYVLQRFGMRQPTYVNNIGTRVRDMEIRKIPGINEGISMKKAWSMMAEMNAVTLPIVDANNVLDGIITINDIATSYMENQDSTMIAKAKTPYCNILETLEAKMLVGDPDAVFEHGNVVIAVANPDVMENYIEKDDMVITGNRYESQLSAIESGADALIVTGLQTGSAPTLDEVREMKSLAHGRPVLSSASAQRSPAASRSSHATITAPCSLRRLIRTPLRTASANACRLRRSCVRKISSRSPRAITPMPLKIPCRTPAFAISRLSIKTASTSA